MAVMDTSTFAKAKWPGVNAWWGAAYNEHSPEYPDLFTMDSSNQNYEEDVKLTGFGLAPIKREGAGIEYDTMRQGYVTRYTHVVYGLGYIVTQEEIEDNLYDKVARSRTKSLAFSMRQTKEIVAANVYNRGFNSSYTFGDGKELLATDHASQAGTWSNELNPAADFSQAALEDLLIMIMDAENDRGFKINLMAQSLIVPTALWFEANRVLKSVQESGTANNDVNVLKMLNVFPGGIKLNHYLTDSDAFFIRTNVSDGLKCYQRREISFTQDNDFDTENLKYKATERYSFGCTDPLALFGSSGS